MSYFDTINFNENSILEYTLPETCRSMTKSYSNIIYTEGTYIKNCDCFVNEQMIAECGGNQDLVRASAILEGAKFDLALKNFMKEGEDYKGLKSDLNEIIKANNMSDREIKSGKNGLMHACKRILQVVYDLEAALVPVNGAIQISTSVKAAKQLNALYAGFGVAGASTAHIVIGGIVGLVIGFIVNRLLRMLFDTIEFNTVKKDAESIVSDLRREASKAADPKIADKFNAEADRLEASIEKYSKKN